MNSITVLVDDIQQCAIYQTLAFFTQNKTIIMSIINLIVAHTLNIFWKYNDVEVTLLARSIHVT